jgi:hypothetical protein
MPVEAGLPTTNVSRRPSLRETRSTSARRSSRPTVSLRGARRRRWARETRRSFHAGRSSIRRSVTPALAQFTEAA